MPIKLQDLVEQGAYTREVDPLASTEFTYSRFFTPWLAGYKGWALFCDCDFLFLGELLAFNPITILRKPFIAFSTIISPKTA